MVTDETLPSARHLRRGRLRVNTGCATCRKRHVKCDEGKPVCANCKKKDRLCSYSGNLTSSSRDDAVRDALSLPQPTTLTSPTTPVLPVAETAPVSTEPGDILHAPDPTSCEVEIHPPLTSSLELQIETSITSQVDPAPPLPSTLGSILLNTDHVSDPYNLPPPQTADAHLRADTPEALYHSPLLLRLEVPVKLAGTNVTLFRNYVENVSHWIDSFSSDRPFHRVVPILALSCPTLLHSCLALAAKQMSLVETGSSAGFYEREAFRYYRQALSAIRALLLRPQFAQSDEVLAACIIMSTYEMIDVVGNMLGSHLSGVASLLQSRQVTGDACGIRGSCYWTWYRQETWAALQTGRCMSLNESYWEPPVLESFEQLEPEDIANRVIYIFGQCINFCNDGPGHDDYNDWLKAREEKAAELNHALDSWKAKLPTKMHCFPIEQSPDGGDGPSVVKSLWFIFSQSAIAHEVYHASKIILILHHMPRFSRGRGLLNSSFLSIRQLIEHSRKQIFLTAQSGVPGAWGLLSCQCLYIAGLLTEDKEERQRTLELIMECQEKTGRRTSVLADELKGIWEGEPGSWANEDNDNASPILLRW